MTQNTPDLSHIAPALHDQAEPVAGLSLDPANVRLHPVRNVDAIKASLRKFGQQRPIIADAKGVVIAGNGTLTAALELGWSHLAVTRSNLTGTDATAFAIADNRTAELAEWDREALARQLEAIQGSDLEAALATGHTQDELAALIAQANGNAQLPDDAAGKAFDETCADDVKLTTCPHCGKEFPV